MKHEYTRGWLSEEETDHIYLPSGKIIAWTTFATDSCTGISASLARRWAIKLQELSIRLSNYADSMEIEMTDTEESNEDG